MDGVRAHLFGFPGADVADFAIVVIVPTLAWDRVGDGFAQFVRRGGAEHGESIESTLAAGAARVRHDGVENIVGSGVVIAAEILAGGGAVAHGDGSAGGEIEEIQSVGGDGGKDASIDLRLKHLLDGGIVDGVAGLGRSEIEGTDALAVANGLTGDAVLGELVNEGAGEDEIVEGDELLGESGVGAGLPGVAPEDAEDFDVGEERPIAVGELRSGSRGVADVRVERNNADRMLNFGGGRGFLARCTSGHGGLLVGVPDGGLEEARAARKRLAENSTEGNTSHKFRRRVFSSRFEVLSKAREKRAQNGGVKPPLRRKEEKCRNPHAKAACGARGLLSRYCRDPSTARQKAARKNMPGRSGRDEQSRKGTGLKTGVYKSKPEKNRTLENQRCGTQIPVKG